MSINISINTGLVVLYIGPNAENVEIVSCYLKNTVASLLTRTAVPAPHILRDLSDIGVVVADTMNADHEFLQACAKFLFHVRNTRPDICIIVISDTHNHVANVMCDSTKFYSNLMAEIITQAGREWAQRRAERQLREHSLDILYAIARKADPSESLKKLMELWLPYLDIPFVDKALLVQAARLHPILNLRTGDRDICAPAQDNIFQGITALSDPTSETNRILEVLCYFERMLQQQITVSLSYAINNTTSKFGADNPLVKALQQLVKNKPAEVSAIYTR